MTELLEINQISPSIRKVGIQEKNKSYHAQFRINYDYELIYCHLGHFQLEVENQSLILQAGDFVLIPPATQHRFLAQKLFEAYWVHFDFIPYSNQIILNQHVTNNNNDLYSSSLSLPEIIRPKIIISPNLELPLLIKNQDLSNKEFFIRLIDLYTEKPYLWELEAKIILIKLIIFFIQEAKELTNKDLSEVEIVHKTKIFITEHYHRQIKMSELGELLSYHPDTINRIFKNQTDTTISNYIKKYRINRATEILLRTNLTLNIIAELTGFEDVSYFCKTYKKETGFTPTKMRNQKEAMAI